MIIRNRFWWVAGIPCSLLAGVLAYPILSAGPFTSPGQSKSTTAPLVTWKPGDTAFIRVRRYTTLSGDPAVQDMFGGSGYVLKNLSSGLITPIAEPASDDPTFSFGDRVTLIEKKHGLPVLWLVSKDQKRIALPAYVLTTNKAEIEFLKKRDRIPDSMTFVYKEGKDEILKTWGIWIAGTNILESHGLALLDYAQGTSPFALKGNAVVFDEFAAKESWDKPPVFDANKKLLQVSPSRIYYCVSGGNKPAFESINLREIPPDK